ncbi:MAG: FtsQ-type POTRA domain-containing protein [Clostridiales Family XIII bacterium]|jgi:cell division protein FtsQ|nr:FtsQ-type POTRA domain-containing protein [Clostridiales Family XIII bacterium]
MSSSDRKGKKREPERSIYFGDELDSSPGPKWNAPYGLGADESTDDAEREALGAIFSGGDDPESMPQEQNAPPRKKRKKKHFFLKFVIFVATVASLYLIATSPLFEIRGIEVTGNEHFTAIELIDKSGIKTGDNLWKVKTKEARKNLEKSSYIKAAEVKRIFPKRISITVTERKPYFAVLNKDTYFVSDVERIVLYTGKEAPALPIVENLEVKGTAGEAMKVEQKTVLDDTILLLAAAEKVGFSVSRIVISDIDVQVYLGEGLKCKGNFANIIENMDGIRAVVADLQAKGISRGTLIISGNGTCTYTPDENV